jgi:general secretion pathway protein F/type IV pilus assembly protein PilC
MPEFNYTARKMDGQLVSGLLSAGSKIEAINSLSNQSLFPVSVDPVKKAANLRLNKRVGAQAMSTFYAQLAGLLRSGVPLLRSIKILGSQSSNPSLSEALQKVESLVEEGESLGDAMSAFPKIFNEVAVNMARAGAEGGFLEDALDRVGKFTEQQADLKARTVGALIYPVILAVAGISIVSILIVFFVPKFGEMFDQLRERGELPMMTDWLLGFSESIQGYWYLILIFFAILGLVITVQLKSESGKRSVDYLKLKLPLFGPIFKNLAVARFCRVLGTLLKNGVPILKSLEISRAAAGNIILSEAVQEASENITAGASLAQPLSQSGHFPKTVVEMISVAEESNTLDTVLVDVADGLEVRTSRALDLLVRMIEPVMLLAMAGIVLFVVIALLLPVIKMSSALQ